MRSDGTQDKKSLLTFWKILLIFSVWTGSLFLSTKAEFPGFEWSGDSRVATPQQLRHLRPCFSEGYFEDETDCRRFYRCVNYGSSDNAPLLFRHDFECAPGTIFDPSYSICNHPLRVHSTRSSSNSCVFPLQLQLLSQSQFQEYSPRGNLANSNPTNNNNNNNNDDGSINFNSDSDSNSNAEPDSNSIVGFRSNFASSGRRQGKSRKFPVQIPAALAASPYNRIHIFGPSQFSLSPAKNYYTYGEPIGTSEEGKSSFFPFNLVNRGDEDDDGLLKIKSSSDVQGKFSKRILEKFGRNRLNVGKESSTDTDTDADTDSVAPVQDESQRLKLFRGRTKITKGSESQEAESSENVTVISITNSSSNANTNSNSNLNFNSKSGLSTKENIRGQATIPFFHRYQVQIPYSFTNNKNK